MILPHLIFFAIIMVAAQDETRQTSPIVTIKSGKIQGTVLQSHEGRDYHAFLSIPFGKSTAGLRRFKPPEPVDPWDGIYNASKLAPVECPQIDEFTNQFTGTEDCLIINVYRPQVLNCGVLQDVQLPTLVFIHGGGFVYGSAAFLQYGPQKYMDHDVILVTFNYRLGIFGFFNSEDSVSPGNYGMLDQVLALHWVKENIASFGGNPEMVTIFGESAGAASVIYHMISPLSKGLFSAAIAQSGTVLNPWAFQERPLEWAKKLAEEVHCPINTTKSMFDCFKKSSMETLLNGSESLQQTYEFPLWAAPSIEGPDGEGFLTANPEILIKEHKIQQVPFFCGIDRDEGYYFYAELSQIFKNKGHIFLKEDLESYLSVTLNKDSGLQHLATAVKKHYFENMENADPEVIKRQMIVMLSDSVINAGVVRTMDSFAEAGIPTFAYQYTYESPLTFVKMQEVDSEIYVTHGDELLLQFQVFDKTMNAKETVMSRKMNSLWANIAAKRQLWIDDEAKTLWEPYHPTKHPNYLELDSKTRIAKGKFSDKDLFWVDMVPKLINNCYMGLRDEL